MRERLQGSETLWLLPLAKDPLSSQALGTPYLAGLFLSFGSLRIFMSLYSSSFAIPSIACKACRVLSLQ